MTTDTTENETPAAVSAEELTQLIERVETIEEEIKGAQDDRKDVYAEAKARGYDVKAMRKIVAIRKLTREQFQEESAVLETYLSAMGLA